MTMLNEGPRPPLTPPLAPSDYLRLRRRSAGLTIDQLAHQIAGVFDEARPLQDDDRYARARKMVASIRDQILLLERAGVRARVDTLLSAIERVIPFDAQVYQQLAEDPADRHPLICRSCGCSSNDPCVDNHSVCRWVSPQLCSHCAMEDLR